MEFPEDKRKLSTGKSLIKFFLYPMRPVRNGTVGVPGIFPNMLRISGSCLRNTADRDVVTEREIKNRLAESSACIRASIGG